jgi:hypothetical protein
VASVSLKLCPYLDYTLVGIVFKLINLNIVEFAVAHLRDVIWDPSPFENLVLPDKQKNIIRALAESQKIETDKPFDDFVKGKGQGLVILLQYDFYVLFLRLNSADAFCSGPAGVGKTLTAEGISEFLKRPLYAV